MPHFGPLKIDMVATPAGGGIGMVHCPGRCVAPWQRNLTSDLAAIEAWGANGLVSLIEGKEFAALGVAEFPQAILATTLDWHHIPIADMQAPGVEAVAAWEIAGPALIDTLAGGGRIVLHCAAGLGRTGTMAAKILTGLGVAPQAAVAEVRRARAGTIETAAQEAFVLEGAWPPITVPTVPAPRS